MARMGKNLKQLLETATDVRVAAPVLVELDGEKVYKMDVNKVIPDPMQPRKSFDEKAQQELENSIRIHGIIQPLILTKRDDKFMIVAGERRFRAAKSLGLETVPAIVKQATQQQLKEIALIENLQREDLNAMEEAEALKELSEMYKLTQEQLSVRIGKSRSNIANTMRLLTLDREAAMLVRQGRLSAGHARALLALDNPKHQVELAYKACDNQMSVRDIEQRVKFYLNPAMQAKKLSGAQQAKISLELKNMVDDMKRVFKTKVRVKGNDNKGRIFIDYFTRDDLQRIFELLDIIKRSGN